MRIDVYLVDKGFCSSRSKAKELLLNCGVKVNGVDIVKPSHLVSENDIVTVKKDALMPYVSKGGLKLKKAIDCFKLDFRGKYILDIGASTGGFTDCAIKHGAEFVWAIDVGNAQLVDELKADERVCSIENTDFRDLNPKSIGKFVDFIVGDLSFISLKHILKHIPKFLDSNGYAILLIKPQFEVGVKNIDKGGIVNNPKAHVKAINDVAEEARIAGLHLSKLTSIPIVDIKKNIEYMAMFEMQDIASVDVEAVVRAAFFEKRQL